MKEKNMGRVYISGKMDHVTMVIGTKIESKVTENTNGKMEELT